MALVELSLSPLAAHVRTARLVVVAAARRAGLDDGRVDELRFALGEACSRAVGLHAAHAPDQPVVITVDDLRGTLVVTVTDKGPAAGPPPVDLSQGLFEQSEGGLDVAPPDVALAVVAGLVDDVTIAPSDVGTTVTMRWSLTPTAV